MSIDMILLSGLRIILLICVAGGVFATLYAVVHTKEKNLPAGTLVVRPHRGFAVVGIICMLFFGALLVFTLLAPTESWRDLLLTTGIFGFFFLLGLGLALWVLRWRLLVFTTGVAYTPVLGRTQFLTFEELYFMQTRGQYLTVYDHYGKRVFTAEGTSIGSRAQRVLQDRLLARGVHYGELAVYRQNAAVYGKPTGQRKKRYMTKNHQSAPEMPVVPQNAPFPQKNPPADLPENTAELLRALLLDAVQLAAVPAEQPLPLGAGKVGGAPDVPAGFAWPYSAAVGYDGPYASRPLAFLAQLPCAQLKDYDAQDLLPASGLLSVFYELESMLWGPATAADGYFHFFWFDVPTSTLVRTPPPPDLKAEYHIPEGMLRYTPIKTAPEYSEFSTGLALRSHMANLGKYLDIRESLAVVEPDRSQVFGYAASIQNDVLDDFDTAWLAAHHHKLQTSDARRRASRRLAKDWVLLLQLDSSLFAAVGAPQIMFGDAGALYFAIRKTDLAARRFGEVWQTLQCY